MADVDIPQNILIALGGVGSAAAGALGWVFKNKQGELDRLQARYDVLQDKYEAVLKAAVENEPARKDALLKIAQALADNNTLIRAQLRSPADAYANRTQ